MKETKELLKFVIELGEAADKALVDGKFDTAELGLLVGPLMQIAPAIEGIDKVGEEFKSLDEAKMAELVQFVKDELDLEADKVEQIVEKGLETALVVFSFVKLFKKEEEAKAE